ncbi:Hypothetical predicted protein [Octopus vulgaris]|uniref:Uncharacterized protein n=2 Tax=Octopus TaxID=6643 RepID=A0AA36BV48_OCTVU|nr:uncharacterized protein LOC115224357 [Octopus sinensis]CAI9740594.1 Hypothetical predicted protein [Octopus vulgaris]
MAAKERVDLEMTPRQIEYFIKLYREHEFLWNPRHENYNLRSVRAMALKEIASQMGTGWTGELVQKRWNTLKSNYARETRKIQESIRSGASVDEIYTPTWWLFKPLNDFLQGTYHPRHPRIKMANIPAHVVNPLDQGEMDESVTSWPDEHSYLQNRDSDCWNGDASNVSQDSPRLTHEAQPNPNIDDFSLMPHTLFIKRSLSPTNSDKPKKSKSANHIETRSVQVLNTCDDIFNEFKDPTPSSVQVDVDEMFGKIVGEELRQIKNESDKYELKIQILSLCRNFKLKRVNKVIQTEQISTDVWQYPS